MQGLQKEGNKNGINADPIKRASAVELFSRMSKSSDDDFNFAAR